MITLFVTWAALFGLSAAGGLFMAWLVGDLRPSGWAPQSQGGHFMNCRTCGLPFDMRDLDQVVAHEHDGLHEATGITGERV